MFVMVCVVQGPALCDLSDQHAWGTREAHLLLLLLPYRNVLHDPQARLILSSSVAVSSGFADPCYFFMAPESRLIDPGQKLNLTKFINWALYALLDPNPSWILFNWTKYLPSAGFFKWKGYDWKPNPGLNLNLICLLVTYLPAWKMLFCRCLLLTHFSCFRALDLGFRTVQEKFVKLNQELSRLQGAYRDAQEGELSSYYGSWIRSWVGNREPTEMHKKVSRETTS